MVSAAADRDARASADQRAREVALDPGRSFVVQAPAGSGKTGLLIQRYLTLLATVDEPEQIVAITFTRKAAAEMRHRVAAALEAAEAEAAEAEAGEAAAGEAAAAEAATGAAGHAPIRPHEAVTRERARAVLARDAERGWSLTSSPERMRIQTLDALNAWLARRLPVLASGVAGAGVAEDAEALYREAAERTVAELDADDGPAASLRELLRTLDNDAPRLEGMLAALLPRREQWLPYFAGEDPGALRVVLEQALARLVGEELEAAAAAVPQGVRATLVPLLRHAAEHAADARCRETLSPWLAGSESADVLFTRVEAWRGIAEVLLTREDAWRRRLDRRLGFGPKHAAERGRLEALLGDLEADAAARDALAFVRRLPAPRYSETEWRTLTALRDALLHAAAELRLVFASRQAVDFVELALAAQQALGRVDRPSDLLLALDRRIRHVLVDEFQDTSHSQLRLLELLTAGWQPDDGRTLFLVGDPMQSIYRFRDADMSLFLRVRAFGVGAVRCEPLTLQRNFRSAPEVVAWNNETFARAFPLQDDPIAGAARFSPSVAAREATADAGIVVHALHSDDVDEELAAAIAIVEREQARAPAASIGVLVQSRTHLAGLHAHLEAKGLAVHAVEIDPLDEHPVVQDLLGLTRALLHPADRIAWLALLRAPWCGLRWVDLAVLCADDRESTLIELLADSDRLARLDAGARARVANLRAVLMEAFERRAREPFSVWIEQTWRALDGPSCLASAAEAVYAEQFFAVLEERARRGDVDDPAALAEAFTKPRGQAEAPAEARVEIMTIHRAKGLEFDVVVLLGLGREPRRERRRALSYMQRVARDGSEDFIMAPLPRPGEDDALCRFVERAENGRDRAERARLLYVAVTRARERLHLVCRVSADRDAPPERTLLSPLWPRVAVHFETAPGGEGAGETDARQAVGAADEAGADKAAAHEAAVPDAAAPEAAAPEAFEPVLRRLADGFEHAEALERRMAELVHARRAAGAAAGLRPEFEWAGQAAVQVGTIVHAYLHRIAEAGLEAWSVARVAASRPLFERELALLGLDREELEPAAGRVERALAGVLADPRGRWILDRHSEAASELRLTLRGDRCLEHVQLDRTFVADGLRWIIDFKTSAHEGGELEAFLDSEAVRYRAQLERYARTMAAVDARPARVGLYFPLQQAFRSWEPERRKGSEPYFGDEKGL